MREYLEAPILPSVEQLRQAEAVMPGMGRQLIDAHFESLRVYDKRVHYILEQGAKEREHFRKNQALSIVSGVFLAISSITLSGVAIVQEANLLHVAMVLGPVTGLAGVFLWGYRPRDDEETKKLRAAEKTAGLQETTQVQA